jgi:hypothetical protein
MNTTAVRLGAVFEWSRHFLRDPRPVVFTNAFSDHDLNPKRLERRRLRIFGGDLKYEAVGILPASCFAGILMTFFFARAQ